MLAANIAKVYRDNLMKKLHEFAPYYNWCTNVGYGTKKHLDALTEYGASENHRKLFVKKIIHPVLG